MVRGLFLKLGFFTNFLYIAAYVINLAGRQLDIDGRIGGRGGDPVLLDNEPTKTGARSPRTRNAAKTN